VYINESIVQLTALLTLASSFPLNSHNEYAAPFISFSATCDNLPAVKKAFTVHKHCR